MASLQWKKNHPVRIQFSHPVRGRQTLRLGKIDRQTAQDVKLRVERLLASVSSGFPIDSATAAWVGSLSADFYDSLAGVGLLAPRAGSRQDVPTLLGAFLDAYIAGREKLAANTYRNLVQSRRILVGFFGEDRDLRTIIAGDADAFVEHLRGNGYAEATRSREIKRAKQFFRSAIRKRLLDENPFEDIKAGSQVNKSRFEYVTRETTDAVIAACPDYVWRLIVSMARYGGLRCPSELQTLKWTHIDWDDAEGRIAIHSPKTGLRTMPFWPELRPYLTEAFERANDGDEYVLNRYREKNVNLGTEFNRIVERAGVKPWGKPFQNMRASRETELAHSFPLHLVCEWIGNSEAVAKKHYVRVIEEDIRKATQIPTHLLSAGQCIETPSQNGTAVSPAITKDTAVQVPPRGVEPRFSD